ncbi:MAG: hypothetical protein ACRD3B_18010 [Candidatus Sulfotelmatobacter sp.]
MEVRFSSETESRLRDVGEVREMLDARYDDLKSGRAQAVDGDQAFADLRKKSDDRHQRA